MSRSNFLDFLSRGWSRLRLSHEVEHSKKQARRKKLRTAGYVPTQLHMACMPDCSSMSVAMQVTVCSTVITVATNL